MTSIPTSLRRCLIVWVATSPTCATNFSFRLSAWVQPSHGHRLVATYRRSMWNARCMATAACVVAATVAVAVQRVGLAGEERRVALDLDQVEAGGGIDHLLEQPGGVHLGVGEAHPVGAHVLRVAADVRDHEQRTPGRPCARSYCACTADRAARGCCGDRRRSPSGTRSRAARPPAASAAGRATATGGCSPWGRRRSAHPDGTARPGTGAARAPAPARTSRRRRRRSRARRSGRRCRTAPARCRSGRA